MAQSLFNFLLAILELIALLLPVLAILISALITLFTRVRPPENATQVLRFAAASLYSLVICAVLVISFMFSTFEFDFPPMGALDAAFLISGAIFFALSFIFIGFTAYRMIQQVNQVFVQTDSAKSAIDDADTEQSSMDSFRSE